MEIARFEELLDRLGEDPSTWPDEERTAALVLLQTSPQAKMRLEEMQRLRKLLALEPMEAAPEDFVDRLMARADDLTKKNLSR